MKYRFIGAIALSALLITSCEEDKIIEEEKVVYNSVNEWIFETMKTEYLWNDEIRNFDDYNYNAPANVFFSSLISENEKKTNSAGNDYCYSYIEEDDSRLITINGLSYGIHFINYRTEAASTRFICRILYVIPDSPADKAGLKRGDFIMSRNGRYITSTNYNSLISGSAATIEFYRGVLTPEEVVSIISTPSLWQSVEISASTSIEVNPVLSKSVIEYGGKKVGYLNFLQFSMGNDGTKDQTYVNQLKNVFAGFKSSNIDELILDLRYNGGGYLEVARTLASMIVPTRHLNSVFCKLKYNSNNSKSNRDVLFNNSLREYNIGVTRVYILTTEATASASEAVLNGLAASSYMQVVHIGTKTEGKNLGSVEYKNEHYPWILHPIVSSIANADGFGEYFSGISPSQEMTYDESKSSTYMGQLGEQDDPMIEIALMDMTGTKSASLRVSTSSHSLERASGYIKPYNYNSIIIE